MASPINSDDVFGLDDEIILAEREGEPVGKAKAVSKKQQTAAAIAKGDGAAIDGKTKPTRGGTKPDQPKRKGGKSVNVTPALGGSLAAMPAGELRDVELSELTFDPDMQKRTAIFDEFTVEKYKEHFEEAIAAKAKDPTAMEPSHVLKHLRAIDTGDALYIWDGFQRGEAARRAKLDTVPIVITKGTKEDAEFFALRANADHGLARSSNDCRRALAAVLDTPALFARVDAEKDSYGGLTRALSASCGVSKGFVSNYLNSRGQTVRAGKMVKLPAPRQPKTETPATPPAAVPIPDATPGLFDTTPPNTDGLTGQALVDHLKQHEQRSAEEQSKAIKATATRIILHEAKILAAKLARICSNLVERPDVSHVLAKQAAYFNLPIAIKKRETAELVEGRSMAEGTEEYPVWQAVEDVCSVLENTAMEIATELEKPAEPVAPPAPAPEPAPQPEPKAKVKKSKGKGK